MLYFGSNYCPALSAISTGNLPRVLSSDPVVVIEVPDKLVVAVIIIIVAIIWLHYHCFSFQKN